MALIQCDFYSEALGMGTTMNVILPQSTHSQIGLKNFSTGTRHPVLYLFHGLSDDHSIWVRRTSIERYVASMGLAVVMPAVGRSFYTDMAHGQRYWTFISEELPRIAQGFFPLSSKRNQNFAAGLSMGGYGALKLAFSKPDQYAAVASLSGVVDPSYLYRHLQNESILRKSEFHDIFGDMTRFRGSPHDLNHLAQKVSKKSKKGSPRIYLCCGYGDRRLRPLNLEFFQSCKKRGLNVTYEEGPGEHDWAYWDQQIQRVLQWITQKS